MGATTRSKVNAERKNWDKIFNALVQMLQKQQTQLHTLVTERKLLEDRIRMQHDRWVSDIHLYEDHISQMKGDLQVQDMEREREKSKLDFAMCSKKREAYLCLLKLEHTDSELEDFKALFNLVSDKCSDPLDIPRNSLETSKTGREGKDNDKALEGEVKRLRRAYEKLASEKSSEVSALLAEKKFVWNQYNIMENDFSSKLRSKDLEVERANQRIAKILESIEQLQSSNLEKDTVIATLKDQLGKMENESSKLNEQVSKLSHDLELLRKSKSASVTPVLNRCTSGSKTTNTGRKFSGNDRINIIVKKESSSVQVPQPIKDSEKKGRSSKRKSVLETPKLFTSNFKVPKLKSPICIS